MAKLLCLLLLAAAANVEGENVCTCTGGTAATGATCTSVSELCTACDAGFTLSETSCQANECTIPAVTDQGTTGGNACAQTTIVSGAMCTTQCAKGYVPSVASLACTTGTLTPATFTCATPTDKQWIDGTLCAFGSTCSFCANNATWWNKDFFTACGSQPPKVPKCGTNVTSALTAVCQCDVGPVCGIGHFCYFSRCNKAAKPEEQQHLLLIAGILALVFSVAIAVIFMVVRNKNGTKKKKTKKVEETQPLMPVNAAPVVQLQQWTQIPLAPIPAYNPAAVQYASQPVYQSSPRMHSSSPRLAPVSAPVYAGATSVPTVMTPVSTYSPAGAV